MESATIDGTFEFSPQVHGDHRGSFHEWFRWDALAERLGHSMNVAQGNCSVSGRGALRGVHFTDVPPGTAKYVTCVRGAIEDVVVDLRVGSPTFGRWKRTRLDARTPRCVYLGEGLGHAFMALEDDTTVVYLCSQVYDPAHEHGLDPLSPDLGITWPDGIEPIVSAKDAAAPSLLEARDSGLLPDYETCLACSPAKV